MSTPQERPQFLFIFANSDRALTAVAREREAILQLFTPLQHQEAISTEVLPDATPSIVMQAVLSQRNNNLVDVVHFGGHATPSEIMLERDRDGSNHLLGEYMAQFLGLQRNLKLVFLNACSTASFAKALNQAGVPCVVGTASSVDDEVAASFATAFYTAILLGGDCISDAFQKAKVIVQAQYGNQHPDLLQSSTTRELSGASSHANGATPFQLYQRDGAEVAVKWKINRLVIPSNASHDNITNYYKYTQSGTGNVQFNGPVTNNNHPHNS